MSGLTKALPRGLLVIQLDGVSIEALRRGLRRGPMPAVSDLIKRRSHELVAWRAGAPAQTSSSQAAIMYGDDFDIPSFRWYEKERGRLMVSNHPGDAAEIDRRARRNGGLLAHNGSSIGNLVSGGATRSILTMGTLTSEVRSTELYRLLLDPRFMGPEIVKMAREFALEVGQGTRQKVRMIRPRAKRGGSFPFLRAISNVLVRDLTTRIVRADLAAAMPTIYATYVGYDVVAHHAGPFTGDALRVLGQLDREILRLIRASRRSRRTYDIVLLSDHGQTPGATFRQRFGLRLEDLVRRLAAGQSVSTGGGTTESWGYLNQILSGAVQGQSRGARRARRALAPRLRDGYVEIGPDRYSARSEKSQVIVANSGNLAHVYLARLPGRLSVGEVRAAVPGLVEGLVDHAGIDFVMGRHPDGGGLIIGKRGIHDLTSGHIEGDDPLEKFGPDAPESMRRLNEFPHAGDLVLNSRFDPANETVAAFEDMVGSHGGLGGPQNEPFLLVPRSWDAADVTAGGRAIHDLLAAHVPEE